LSQLQSMVPLLRADALSLMQHRQYEEALNRIDSIASLQPDELEYTLIAANLHQTLFHFEEAARLYRKIVERTPSHAAARESLDFCRAALTSWQETNGQSLSSGLLLELHRLMTRQERYGEARTIYEKLGDDRQRLFGQWKGQLEQAGIVGPALGKLKMDADGYLSLVASSCPIHDISALKGMPFWKVHIPYTKVQDLTPLIGMPLRVLDVGSLRIRDLKPLTGSPLTNLSLFGVTGISDISPLAGCPLQVLNLEYTDVVDLTPLVGAPLNTLMLSGTPVEDLGPIQKMPLKMLDLQKTLYVRDLSPLAGVPLNWLRLDGKITDLGPLEGTPLEHLTIMNCPVTSLSVLTSTPISSLRLEATQLIRDLGQIRSIALKKLELDRCEIGDLQAVSDMPLEYLKIVETPIKDLIPLKQLPLKEAFIGGTKDLDVAPLAECKQLESVVLPRQARNIQRLKSLPRLRSISFYENRQTRARPAADFWNFYDGAPPLVP
jgi:hypothetical protein